ncbi:MAG: Hsp70 family protein [Ilumatobacter sp.]
MGYQVGIDLGTTFTAAAVHRDGRSQIFGLGTQTAAMPSVVLLREDATELTGEAAVRRALNEPERVAREFKRRLGDSTPIIVGGAPYSAEQLMARLLTRTITDIAQREGGAPDRVAVTHPANWGPYKIDLLNQAIRIAGVPEDRVDLLTEPEAAAISYANQERVDPGQIVAVYDLGGGTFDAAVLRRTEDGFEIMGRPEGIERMGGIDFDAAVFAHVNRALEGKLQELDPEDPMVMSGVARLREECVDAKIALSSDTDATIAVLLPNLQTDVRITRNEFESLIRPSLSDSIAAMHRALQSAGITAADVAKVLLVGGSSRIPLISQMVSSELGRPVAVDADPKHAIALGAAGYAATAHQRTLGAAAADGAAGTGATGGAAAAAAAAAAPSLPPTTPMPATPATPPAAAPAPQSTPQPAPQPAAAAPQSYEPTTPIPQQATVAAAAAPVAPGAPPTGGAPAPAASDDGSKMPLILGAVAAVAVLAVGAFVVLGGGGDEGTADPEPVATLDVADEEAAPVDDPVDTVAADTTVAPDTVAAETTVAPENTVAPETTQPEPEAPDDATIQAAVASVIGPDLGVFVDQGVALLTGRTDEDSANNAVSAAQGVEGVLGVTDEIVRLAENQVCTDEIQQQDRWVCITNAEFDGTTLFASFDFGFPADDAQLNTQGGYHLHFYNGDVNEPVDAGTPNGGLSNGSGLWEVWDDPSGYSTNLGAFNGALPSELCVEVANPTHSIENLDSGTCFPVATVQALSTPDAEASISRRRAISSDNYVCNIS